MDRGAWQARVYGVTKESDTTERLNNNTTTSFTPIMDCVTVKINALTPGYQHIIHEVHKLNPSKS